MWKTVQCAVQGRGHKKNEIPCQDKTFVLQENGVVVAALADGAGSATQSQHGAEYVVNLVCREFVQNFERYYGSPDGVAVKEELVAKIDAALEELKDRLQCNKKELASTLLAAAVKEERFILLHIGDGVIGYARKNRIHTASGPVNGEFANSTVFTTSEDVIYHMKLIKGERKDIDGFVLMSDGTAESLYDRVGQKPAELWKSLMQMSVLLPEQVMKSELERSFLHVVTACTLDDCSMVLLVSDDKEWKAYSELTLEQKRDIYHLKETGKALEKRIERKEELLELLEEGEQSLALLARKMYLKPKYAKRQMETLLQVHFVEWDGRNYRRILLK